MTFGAEDAAAASETVGDLIRRLRIKAELSQQALAVALSATIDGPEVHRETVNRWENGRHLPDEQHREALGQVLHAAPEEFSPERDEAIREKLERLEDEAAANRERLSDLEAHLRQLEALVRER